MSEQEINQPDLSQPETPRQYLRLFGSGFAMGCSDIVPGVSGGTMAFILGVYENLVNAIKSFDLTALRLAFKFEVQEFIEHTSLRFLVTLGLGIVTAVLLLSNLLHYLLDNEPTFLFAFFAGLIIASIVAVGLKVEWSTATLAAMVVGAVFAFVIVGASGGGEGNHSAPVLFFSGMIAICAMILPGISGSFILLILGQYDYIIEAVKDFDIGVILIVGLGAGIGIMAFSRVLSWLLKNYEHVTIAALVGFMIGALRLIWIEAVDGIEVVSSSGSLSFLQGVLVIVMILVGFLLVSLLDHMQTRTNPVFAWFWSPTPPEPDVIAEKAEALG